MKTYLDCIPCYLNQALRASRIASSDEAVQQKTLNRVLQELSNLPLEVTPPEIAQKVYEIVHSETDSTDPYGWIKRQSNQLALSLYPKYKEMVENSANPLLTACKLVIAGNSMDFGPQGKHVDIEDAIALALASEFAIDHFESLKQSLEKASQVLYLGDNAGEIVFDKILIELLISTYPCKITYAVRDKPIINDATMRDATVVGLTDVVDVISNGSSAPGTILKQCSSSFRQLFDTADLIVSKGQGNFESLGGESDKIFFFLKAKCNLVAGHLNVQLGDMILMTQYS